MSGYGRWSAVVFAAGLGVLAAALAGPAGGPAAGAGDNPPATPEGARPSPPETTGNGSPASLGSGSLVPPAAADPFPIRRLRASEDRLSELAPELGSGPWVRLPREEFESRVRAAGRDRALPPPRVVDVRLRAAWADGDLQGSGEWDVLNPGAGPRRLVLDPLRLALGTVAWADGREAVLGVPAGEATPVLWVPGPGRQTLRFAWSAVGVTEPGERRFDLRLPVSPTAMLELELPADRVPAVPTADVLVTGPFPLPGSPPRSLWRLRFGGRSRLDLAVRPTGNPGVGSVARLVARYDLTPGLLTGVLEYDLRSAKGTVGTWLFTVDPGLRVTDVVVNNRSGWAVEPAPGGGSGRLLRVDLRQPSTGGKLLIAVAAPFPDPALPPDAPLPLVRPVGADLDEETLELRLPPGLRIEDWNPGDYRITDAQTLPDPGYVLTLTGTLAPPGPERLFRRPPTVRVAVVEQEFTTVEQVTWRLGPGRSRASVRVGVRVRRGPLTQLTMRYPAGYRFVRLGSAPEDLAGEPVAAASQVTVPLARPLATGQSAELIFEFEGPSLPPEPQRLPVPAFTPLAAAERIGVWGVVPAEGWSAKVRPGVGAIPLGWLDIREPTPVPGAVGFRYRGGDPDGWVDLTPAQPMFDVETTAAADGREVFVLRTRSGVVEGVWVADRGGRPDDPRWRVTAGNNAVTDALALPLDWLVRGCGLLAAGSPSVPATDPAGAARLWLLRFARPVADEVRWEAETAGPPGRFHVLGASHHHIAVGTGEGASGQSAAGTTTLTGLYLVTMVRSTREAEVVFGGTVAAGGERLRLGLPTGAELRAVVVGDQWLSPGAWWTDGSEVRLPVPARGPVRFELRYRLPVEPAGLAAVVRSPLPIYGQGEAPRRWWVFGPEVLPGWPVRAWQTAGPAALPELLGEPVAAAGAVIVAEDVDEVRVGPTPVAIATGLLLAVVLFVCGWVGAGRRHPFCGLVLAGGLLATGVATLLGPPWWQRAAGSPLVIGLVVTAGVVVVRGQWLRGAAAVLLLLAVAWWASDSMAQTTAPVPAMGDGPATVVLLPSEGEMGETVVAARAVLDRLAEFSRRETAPVAVVAAEYALVVDGANARVTARFVAHAPEAGVVLTLPLTEARLERVTVNGAAALPALPRPGAYSLILPRAGRNELEVRFVVGIGGSGPEREVRFGVPDGPVARLTATLPGTARQAQVVGRFGRQTLLLGDPVRVEADLGPVRAVVLRWRDGTGGAAAVRVREGCVWDVSEAGAVLTACYVVRVEQGAVSALRFDVPAELNVLGVAVRPLEKDGPAALQDWTASADQDGYRTLRLDFQGPTAGRFLIVLSLSPRAVLSRQPLLRFPRVVLPSGSPPPAEPDAAYGFRVRNVTVEAFAASGVIDFSPDALTRDRDFADVGELWLGHTAPVRVFRPTGPGAELRPTLRVAVASPAFTLDTAWQVAPYRAAAHGSVRWGGKDPVAYVDFSLPGATVTEVRGPEVAGWSRAGARVRVWLRRSLREGEFAWSAGVAPPAFPFDAVTPRPLSGELAADTVSVTAVGGGELAVERDRGWTPQPAPGTFRTTNAQVPPVRLTLTPPRLLLRPDDLGWLAPGPRPPPADEPPVVLSAPASAPADAPPSAEPSSPPNSVAWVWPVSAALAWVAVVVTWAVLYVRLPASTWPEQFGLACGLFGAIVAGGWLVGAYAWGVARLAWLLLALSHRRAEPPLPARPPA